MRKYIQELALKGWTYVRFENIAEIDQLLHWELIRGGYRGASSAQFLPIGWGTSLEERKEFAAKLIQVLDHGGRILKKTEFEIYDPETKRRRRFFTNVNGSFTIKPPGGTQ